MDAETLEALKGSIVKWYGIAFYGRIDKKANDCPLCHLFNMYECVGCPVADKTVGTYCIGSPYARYIKGVGSAIDELIFLISLLPDGEFVFLDDGRIL